MHETKIDLTKMHKDNRGWTETVNTPKTRNGMHSRTELNSSSEVPSAAVFTQFCAANSVYYAAGCDSLGVAAMRQVLQLAGVDVHAWRGSRPAVCVQAAAAAAGEIKKLFLKLTPYEGKF
ncbi:hypothetical protein V6N13_037798 [Hibiscus sabdariffa]